jgi:hypothetical protein
MRVWTIGVLIAALVIGARASSAQSPTAQATAMFKVGAGLQASVISFGRAEKRRATAMLKLENVGRSSVRVMLVVPEPLAVDSFGGKFRFSQFSGIASCTNFSEKAMGICLGYPMNNGMTPALQTWSEIAPGSSVYLTFSFNADHPSDGPLMSMSAVLAVREISDSEAAMTDAQKRATIRTVPVSSPPGPVTDSK